MQLLSSLQTLAEGKHQRSIEINFLIEKTYSIAISYLRLNHKKIFKLLQKGEYKINEIAVDAIAVLFAVDEEKNITPLANSFNNWHPPVETENDALFFLNKVVARRIEQHIFSSLREYDPFFSKILDSVNYLIKTGGYKKICLAGRTCIVENGSPELSGEIIGYEEFDKIPAFCLTDKKKMLPAIFNYIKTETNFMLAVPLNQLVNRIKHINFSDYISGFNSTVRAIDFELEDFTVTGYNKAKTKLALSYVKKGKLTEYEGECIDKALKDMSIDLLDGGINPGMFEYLNVYMPELDKNLYLIKYQSILEYLVKVMKNTIAFKLSKES